MLRQILYHQGEGGGIIQVHQLVYKQLRRHEAEEGGRGVPAFGVDELDGLHHGLIQCLLLAHGNPPGNLDVGVFKLEAYLRCTH